MPTIADRFDKAACWPMLWPVLVRFCGVVEAAPCTLSWIFCSDCNNSDDNRESGGRTECHRDRDRAVELDDGRGHQLRQREIQCRDARPIGVGGVACARMARGNRGLQRVRTLRAAELFGALEGCEPAPDQQAIPARTILLEQQDRLAGGTDARA